MVRDDCSKEECSKDELLGGTVEQGLVREGDGSWKRTKKRLGWQARRDAEVAWKVSKRIERLEKWWRFIETLGKDDGR